MNTLKTSLFYYYFINLTLQKCAINISQKFLRTAGVLSWIALLYFFLTSWIWNTFVFEKILLYKQLFKSDNPLVLGPVIVQSFDFNNALYKAETSLRRTTDTFKTVNGPLYTAKRKCRCTTWQVIAIRVSKLYTHSKYSTRLLTARIF